MTVERPHFIQAIRASADALARPADLQALLDAVYADGLLCQADPSAVLLEECDRRGIFVLSEQGRPIRDTGHECIRRGSALPGKLCRFAYSPAQYPTREAWAAEMLAALRKARLSSAAGICLADADVLLAAGSGPLQWHVAACYRRITPAHRTALAQACYPDVTIGIHARVQSHEIETLDVQWELLDGQRVAMRGAGSVGADPLAIHIRLPDSAHPDQWKEQPRLRVRCFLCPDRSRHTPAPAAAMNEGPDHENMGASDVLAVRRQPRAASLIVQLGAIGKEISRFEVGLDVHESVVCRLTPEAWSVPVGHPIHVSMDLLNLSRDAASVSSRLVMHPAQGRVKSIESRQDLLAPGEGVRTGLSVPGDLILPGANYLLAGCESSLAVSITTCLIYGATGAGFLAHYRNTSRSPARFWVDPVSLWGAGTPARVDLEGSEEKVVCFAGAPPQVVPDEEPGLGPLPFTEDVIPGLLLKARPQPEDFQPTKEPRQRWAPMDDDTYELRLSWDVTSGTTNAEPGVSARCIRFPDGLLQMDWRLSVQACEYLAEHPEQRAGLALTLPATWDKAHWQRRALWDRYPGQHPDSPIGCGPVGEHAMLQTGLERLVILGPDGGMAVLTAGQVVDAELTGRNLILMPSFLRSTRGHTFRMGLFPIQNLAQSEFLWLGHPSYVRETPEV